MTAPTAEDLRAAIDARLALYPGDDPRDKIREGIEALADFMYTAATDVLEFPAELETRTAPVHVWADLRPSEALALQHYYEEASEQAVSDAIAAAIPVIIRGALQFAAEFPDARRAEREPVTA